MGVDSLKPGMILGEDLRHFNGRLILQEGTCVGPQELRIIKMWGLTEAVVESVNVMVDEDNRSEDLSLPGVDMEVEAAAENIFRFSDLDHEVNNELYRLFVQRHSQLQPEARSLERTPIPEPPPLMEPVDVRLTVESDSLTLPSLPGIVDRVYEALNDPKCTATHIAELISKDTGLAARLLKLVNSALYSFPGPISSIARAVAIIGSRQITALTVAASVTDTFKDIPPSIIDMKGFWKHCVSCGIIARLLTGYRERIDTENYFLAGLLHDIGRLVIFKHFPQQARHVFYRAHLEPNLLYRIEPEVLGCDHTELGNLLIQQWRLPPGLEFACHFHHAPMEALDKTMASVVHTADIIANAMRFGTSGEYYISPLDPGAWETLDLPVSVIAPVVRQTETILNETIRMYLNNE